MRGVLLSLVGVLLLAASPVLAQDPEEQLMRGAEWEARGDAARAAEAYARALAQRPGDEFALCRLGFLDFHARRPGEARARFEAVLAVNPGNILARSMRGVLLLREGKNDAAREDFEAALGRESAAVLPNLGLAAALLAEGREAEALDRLAAARTLVGEDPQLLSAWRDMARGLGLPMAARLAQDELVELAPRDPAALVELGWSLRALGEDELARNAWRQALRLAPGDAAAQKALAGSLRLDAAVLREAGEDKRAERFLREAEETVRGGSARPAARQ